MNTLKKFDCLTAGLALFAMFFGAGNIIFPLALGKIALDQTPWGLLGLLLTAVAVPFAGLIAMFRYGGQVRLFFSRLGKIPGLLIATFVIALIGPFGAAPRCIALAYTTFSISFPKIPLILFSVLATLLIFFFTYRTNKVVKLLGTFLSPIKISLLIFIIVKGFIEIPEVNEVAAQPSPLLHFWRGLTEGYQTMDLLAAFFFAPLVLSSLQIQEKGKEWDRFILKASGIGALLLSLVYGGFCYLAYFYAAQLQGLPPDQLLGAIAIKILGSHGGLIVGITVTIACLTTAISLIAAFMNFVHKDLFKEKIGQIPILVASLIILFAMTTLKFEGIARFLNPILEVCYPALIALTFYNLLIPVKKTTETN
jgi:LIVCS family branched-chain amino acid:cation transporter